MIADNINWNDQYISDILNSIDIEQKESLKETKFEPKINVNILDIDEVFPIIPEDDWLFNI